MKQEEKDPRNREYKEFVVTGGGGFIGSHLTNYLVEQGYNVHIIDSRPISELKNFENIKNKMKFYQIDILEKDKLYDVLKNTCGIFSSSWTYFS